MYLCPGGRRRGGVFFYLGIYYAQLHRLVEKRRNFGYRPIVDDGYPREFTRTVPAASRGLTVSDLLGRRHCGKRTDFQWAVIAGQRRVFIGRHPVRDFLVTFFINFHHPLPAPRRGLIQQRQNVFFFFFFFFFFLFCLFSAPPGERRRE